MKVETNQLERTMAQMTQMADRISMVTAMVQMMGLSKDSQLPER